MLNSSAIGILRKFPRYLCENTSSGDPNEVANQRRQEATRGQERTVLGSPGRNCLEKDGRILVAKMRQIALSPNKDAAFRGVEPLETFSANC